jgi:hypothetical protein
MNTEKTSQFFSIPAIGTTSLFIDSKTDIDKLRISFGCSKLNINNITCPGILVQSSLNNDFIGSFGFETIPVAAPYKFVMNDDVKPLNGVEIYNTNKFHISGYYNFTFYYQQLNATLL